MDSKKPPIIEIQNIVKTYPTGNGSFFAINGISLDIIQGEFLGITGKSGAGKTTLLNLISGVSEVTSGEVVFRCPTVVNPLSRDATINVNSMDEDEKAAWRGENLGIVYQSFELMPNLNLVDNVMLPQDFAGKYHPIISKQKALELLELVEIAEHAYKIPAHISGGQKQRVAIARALVNDPPLIIADEPTGNLDTKTAMNILEIFEHLVQRGKTVVMVTHDESLALRFSRRLQISDGKLVGQPGNGSLSRSLNQKSRKDHSSPIETKITPNPFGKNGMNAHITNYSGVVEQTPDKHPKAIILQSVDKTYENAAGNFSALKGIDLDFNQGEFVSIIGKSGCGKSTLLNMITGIDHPTSGHVLIGGKDIYEMSESERAFWRGQNMGVVFQFFQLLPTLTLLENTMLPMDYCNKYSFRERPDRAMELLKIVGLEEHAHKLPANVSSGQQQSAAIARALANDPAILLADEPTGNLDSQSALIILDLFEKLAAQGKTILIVTHDTTLTKRTDKTVILSDGEVVDDTVARALSYLDHPEMLAVTHQIEKRVYSPGSQVIHQGESVDQFFMIAKGEVEVVVNTKIPETTVARLGPGQFFGEISLTMGVNSLAGFRVGVNQPAELKTISKEEFMDLIKNSPRMENALEKVAKLRMEETQILLGNYHSLWK